MRVLVVKMSSLGDVIHTLPALGDAARAMPDIAFDWVVEEAFAEIPAWHPAVREVIPVALRRWRKRPLRALRGPEWRRARAALRRQRYDVVIDAQGLLKSAFIALQVRSPRCGMDWRSAREPLASLAYRRRIAVPKDLHAVERTRLLFARALAYPAPVTPADYGLRAAFAEGAGDAAAQPPHLLLFHGTARAEKLWPRAHWVELARLAGQRGYTSWLPWGSELEYERASGIAAAAGDCARVLPRLDLRGLADRLRQVHAAVAVDTGLGHLAAALDVPAVSLYGPTDTRLIGAYGRHQVHIQSPLKAVAAADPQASMAAITPAQVWRELQTLLPAPD